MGETPRYCGCCSSPKSKLFSCWPASWGSNHVQHSLASARLQRLKQTTTFRHAYGRYSKGDESQAAEVHRGLQRACLALALGSDAQLGFCWCPFQPQTIPLRGKYSRSFKNSPSRYTYMASNSIFLYVVLMHSLHSSVHRRNR
jgi:hypothetical protein